jgi:VanZ family protein
MRSNLSGLFINFFVCYLVAGQTVTPGWNTGKNRVSATGSTVFLPSATKFTDSAQQSFTRNASVTLSTSNYYTSTLGFFCRKELQLEKAVRLPIRLRLGNLAYTDQMEGKGKAVLQPDGKR